MVRCGELCRSCTRICNDPLTTEQPAEIQCVVCDGAGCDDCKNKGCFDLIECPRKFIGNSLTENINMAGFAMKGHLPEDGGILDQDAWFVDMWSMLCENQAEIEHDIRDRRRS